VDLLANEGTADGIPPWLDCVLPCVINNQRSKQLEPDIGRSRGVTVTGCLVGDGVLASSAVSVLESQASLYIGKGDEARLEERNDYQRMA